MEKRYVKILKNVEKNEGKPISFIAVNNEEKSALTYNMMKGYIMKTKGGYWLTPEGKEFLKFIKNKGGD